MHLLFLPGGAGAAEFWHPVGALLSASHRKTYFSWPGLGAQPPAPEITGFADMLALVEAEMSAPCALIAQSMGCVPAMQLALKYPEKISHLILVATSGGIDVARLGGEDWRPAYKAKFPQGADWITTSAPDLSKQLARISCPTLLLWGDADPISPVAVGEYLAKRIPKANLQIIVGGQHNLAQTHAAQVASLITQHLGQQAWRDSI
ncbi:alpha/beta fold hydrolase [Undibacterium sp. Ren11W]|uniref:alpha/beta fold hydrolase n=1 Tax=Undibacterium sp. Ren11W TaxID=3413045 RepID=UPI003BF114FF